MEKLRIVWRAIWGASDPSIDDLRTKVDGLEKRIERVEKHTFADTIEGIAKKL